MTLPLTEQQSILQTVEGFGDVCEMSPLAISWSASGCGFWRGRHKRSGEQLFLKNYPQRLAEEAAHELWYARLFDTQAKKIGCRYLAISCPLTSYKLPDESVMMLSRYIQGRLLIDIIRTGERLSREDSERIADALCECAHLVCKTDAYHRDINPKNLLFDGEKLWLIDFQTAISKQRLQITNPSLHLIRSNCGLGYGYNPWRGVWNDAHSVLEVFRELLPCLTLSEEKKAETLTELQAAVATAETIIPEYVVDDAWCKRMRRVYWLYLLRPEWTCKRTSRLKRASVLAILRDLMRYHCARPRALNAK